MLKTRIYTILVLLIVFVAANGGVYYLMELNKEQRIQLVLESNLKSLETHYEILKSNQKMVADATYASTLKLTPRVIDILTRAKRASKREKKSLRKELKRVLEKQYKILKDAGVLQYQFVLPNNESFLRMHNPSKFGDDVSKTREDFVYTNKTHKPIRDFSKDDTSYAFRNIYPIFDKRDNYVGAMEVSFSSDSLQKYLTSQSQIHKYSLVDKEIFNTTNWEDSNLVLKYLDSGEKKELLLNMNASYSKNECIIQSRINLDSVRKKVENALKRSTKFAVYAMQDITHVDVVSFYPIVNSNSSEASAWIVSYDESPFIYDTLKDSYKVNAVAAAIFFILSILLYKLVVGRRRLVVNHKLVYDVLNSTDDIIFATDFKKVSLSNERFKEFFGIKSFREMSKKTEKNILNIFMDKDKYLNEKLIKEDETFFDLIKNTPSDERIVSVLDSEGNAKLFNISIKKTSYTNNGIYLITLRDREKVMEKELVIQQKAYLDSLTGIFNANRFQEIVEHEFKRDARYKRDLSIAIISIDNFKSLNNTFSHIICDEVIVMLAEYLRKVVRDSDVVARWGKEEFAILFPETNKDDLSITAEKLRVGIEQLSHPVVGKLSASFGITQYEERDTTESMFKRCDNAILEAKANGRNQVSVK
jgi:diguanylate cyclase (GGDEF)-like protein